MYTPVMKYRADWRDYRLFVEWEGDHWTAAVWDLTKKKWAWKGDVLDADDGKSTSIELAIREAHATADEATEARSVSWIATP